MIISKPARIVKNVGTKLATCDPESHRVAKDKEGHVYFSFIDRDENVYVARSSQPGLLTGKWIIQKIFGDDALLANLKVAKFGASLAIDKDHDELSLIVSEKTTHSCIYTRCKLSEAENIANRESWYAEGKREPSVVGYAKVSSIGDGDESLCAVEHDTKGNAILSFSTFEKGIYSVKFTKFKDRWLKPITIDKNENYCWASSLYLDHESNLHIAYESYKDNTVRHKQASLRDCMNMDKWKSFDRKKDFDHALHHQTKPCRAFSMYGNGNKIYFVGHTSPQRQATTDILYNMLDAKKGEWLFDEKENCGKIASVGCFDTYGYPQIGILAGVPVVVYTREGADGRLHINENIMENVYIGPRKTYYPSLEREDTRELNVIFTKKRLLTYDIFLVRVAQV